MNIYFTLICPIVLKFSILSRPDKAVKRAYMERPSGRRLVDRPKYRCMDEVAKTFAPCMRTAGVIRVYPVE